MFWYICLKPIWIGEEISLFWRSYSGIQMWVWSLVYAPVALNSQVVAVLAEHIRKMWKYVRGGENEVCPWSFSLGRRNQCDKYTLVICKGQLCWWPWLWPSVISALCFLKLWYTDLPQWTLQLSPLAQGSAFYPCVRVLVFCVLPSVRLNLSQRRAPQHFWSCLLTTGERKLPSLPTVTSLQFSPAKVLLILKIMMINCPSFAIARNRKNEFFFLYVNRQRLISSIWQATINK